MTFRDQRTGVIISTTCFQTRDHDLVDAGANQNYFKEELYLAGKLTKKYRFYYKGQLLYCGRQGCKYQVFLGDKSPWKVTQIIKGVEYETDFRPGTEDNGVESTAGPDKGNV